MWGSCYLLATYCLAGTNRDTEMYDKEMLVESTKESLALLVMQCLVMVPWLVGGLLSLLCNIINFHSGLCLSSSGPDFLSIHQLLSIFKSFAKVL